MLVNNESITDPSPPKVNDDGVIEYTIPICVLQIQISNVICPLLFAFARSAPPFGWSAAVDESPDVLSGGAMVNVVRIVSTGTAVGSLATQDGAWAYAMLDTSTKAQTVAASFLISVSVCPEL
ncbi:MAG TPA: hypothetical protein VHI13_14060 [Candidatus Kapabacteria bacterium]|nr:hypothetical protein [Candidatus Kapabacteria bacterium]